MKNAPVNTLYIRWLSDEPVYFVCSYRMAAYLGREFMGCTVWGDRYCPDIWGYCIDDKHLFEEVKLEAVRR